MKVLFFWVLALFDRFPTGINLRAVQKGSFQVFCEELDTSHVIVGLFLTELEPIAFRVTSDSV